MKIQTGFTFLVPAYPGCPGNEAVKWVSVYLSLSVYARKQLECGPMPSVMGTLPNIGGALCSMPQSMANAHY